MIRRRVFRLSVTALGGLAIFLAAMAGPAGAASSPPAAAGSVSAALRTAFEVALHLPAADVGGIRTGTLHVGSAEGRRWASASFTPARSATQQVRDSFQDGAASAVFTESDGTWRLMQTGLYGCGAGLPDALRAAWHLGLPAACTTSAAEQRAAASQALLTLPAAARAAAALAVAQTTGAASSTAAPKPQITSDVGQTIAAVALSQVGASATPAVTNFNTVDCDPYSTLVAGFSANSDGCGYSTKFGVETENETWCADFNKWVWEQAGLTTDMNALNAGAVSFYDWAIDQGQRPQLDKGTPQAGDSVVFFNPHSFPALADHVGIVTSVSSTGKIDMVNGDFAAKPDVHVEYDTGITSLTSFAASVWGPGEEWAIVTPPAIGGQPTPTGRISGPAVAVAGTTGTFSASGAVGGGSVTGYYWTFGDGRTTNASGASVIHVFSEPGTYTISVTITASYGTIVTLHRNVRVVAPSSGVGSVPYDGIWYDPLPVLQYLFTRSAGGLAMDSWDGGSWLQRRVPGHPSATGNIAVLSYPDAANADAMTPHAYYRAASGSLAETYLSTAGWVTRQLAGEPAAGSTIVATSTAGGSPAVFFIDRAGNLARSAPVSGRWTSRDLVHVGRAINPASLALADTTAGTDIFAVGPGGTIRVFAYRGGRWAGTSIPARTTRDGSLAALTMPAGQPAVLYVDSRGGHLAEATETGPTTAGRWRITYLPAKPAANSSLAATTYLLPSAIPAKPGSFPKPPGSTAASSVAAPLGTEAFYLTAAGRPAVAFDSGSAWQVARLPGRATSIAGASAYPVAEEPSDLFLSGRTMTEETTQARSGDPSGRWISRTLPDSPATWPGRIVLYAADPAGRTAARAAAAAVGLPARQVVTSFAAAWADTLTGEYLVIAVGTPAVAALSFNVCGWANPSALAAGSTPFSDTVGPRKSEPGPDAFVNSAGNTAANTRTRATDLAYYALRGKLPPRVKSLPAAVRPPRACTGSPR